jgi:hypothetical protein
VYTEGDMIYIVCGTSSDNAVGQFEKDEYDIETNSWKRNKNVPCNLPIFGNLLSVLHQFRTSDYQFDIFKLFLHLLKCN